MLIPSKSESVQTPVINQQVEHKLSVEEQLSEILSMVQGAGKVSVMLTVAQGEQTIYQTDTDTNSSGDNYGLRESTVIISDSARNEEGLIRQVDPPVYLGAVVVCQGADRPGVRLAIAEAVSKLTGLGADKISILKMK